MRFISPAPGYKFQAIKEEVEVLASGLPRTTSPGFICEFRKADTTDWERDYARANFAFKGVPMSESGMLIDPVPSRVSSYDTAVIPNPELRLRVEQRLLETQRPEDHTYVEAPASVETVKAEVAEDLVAA